MKHAVVVAIAILVAGTSGKVVHALGQGEGVVTPGTAPPGQAMATVVVRGTIQQYDIVSKVLTLSTPGGSQKFVIAPDTRVRQHWQPIDASTLERLSGHRAAVRYAESGDVKTVKSVNVFRKEERPE